LKRVGPDHQGISNPSRPAWARGLKQFAWFNSPIFLASRPAWARGLKQGKADQCLSIPGRAPRGRVD